MDEPQKLFRLPGTIEEEEERDTDAQSTRNDNPPRAESPLLAQKLGGPASGMPRNVTLVRVSTQSSSIGGVGRQDSYRSRYRAGPVRKIRRRAVLKNGECNVLQSRISRRSLRFLQDIFTTLVDTQWRWTLLCFSLSFVLSWLGFAVIWWLIAFTHGDFDEKHLPGVQIQNGWTPCVYNIFSFTSCFLFSIETQHTIGYGSRSTTEECPEAIFVMCVQSIAGVMIQAFMVGIVFAKMSRPKQRTQTLLFSRNAVICQRDSELCLMFRVADMRKSHIIGATVRAQVIRTRTTKEGETLSPNQHELDVGTDGQNGNLFFIWPTTIVHKINADSPFFNMSAEDMLTERFEVVVILEGTIESTGQTTQARSSYLPQEILWGHRFEPMVCYSKERQGYEVDHSLFNSTVQVDTPLCSGRELAEFYRVQDDLRHGTGFLVDEDGLLLDPYHEIHQNHYPHGHNHRSATTHIIRAESTKSDNSLDEHNPSRTFYRDVHNSVPHPNQREIGQYKIVEVDPDAIHVIGDAELQHLPEAVNREILKNSREIVYEEDPRETEMTKEESRSSPRSLNHPPKRNHPKQPQHPNPDEEKRSLNDSRRNLTTRNHQHPSPDEEKRSLNDSRRNLTARNHQHPSPDEEKRSLNDSRRNLTARNHQHPSPDEEKRSLNDSRRNLTSRNCPPTADDGSTEKRWFNDKRSFAPNEEDKNAPNGSRPNLNGSKRYLLLALDKSDAWNGSAKNLYVGSRENLDGRRHTGSRERLNVIRRNVVGVKGSKENPELRMRRKVPDIVGDSPGESHVEIEIEKPPRRILGLPELTSTSDRQSGRAPLSADPGDPSPSELITSTTSESVMTPESGFAESNNSGSSPETIRKEPRLPGNSVITRNRRSYEHAQLQDVNEALTNSSSDTGSSDSDSPEPKEVKSAGSISRQSRPGKGDKRQTISYTSV